MKLSPLIALAFGTTLYAQSLAPALAPIAAKYKADVAALESQKTAALTRHQTAYFTALDRAEQTATAAGDVNTIRAITNERDAVKTGGALPISAPDLPKTLQTPRKTYIDQAGRAAAEISARKQRLDADYLRALASLQARAGNNSDLVQQIAEEKAAVLANSKIASPAGGEMKGKLQVAFTLEAGLDEGTVVHVTKDGIMLENGIGGRPNEVYINDKLWKPRWAQPEKTDGPNKSDIFPLAVESLNLKVEVTTTEGRGEARPIKRGPVTDRHRGNELQVTITDPESGPAYYKLVFLQRPK